jgi:hypothetical protein
MMVIRNKRGQAAIESLIVFGIVFFIFIAIFMLYTDKNHDIRLTEKELNLLDDCTKIANHIDNLYLIGSGSSIEFRIYNNFTIEPGSKRIFHDETFCRFGFNRVSEDNLTFGNFDLDEGRVRLIYEDSMIKISNI